MIRLLVFLICLSPLLAADTPKTVSPKSPIKHPYAPVEPSPSPREDFESSEEGDALVSRKLAESSILRVNSTNQAFNFFQPWLKKSPVSRRGVGVLVQGACAGDGRVGDGFEFC